VADASGANPPSPPTALGNMPSGFYPPSRCIKPERKPGDIPDARDSKAMDAHNAEVRRFNALATDFNRCLGDYAARARLDIERIEKVQREAALPAGEPATPPQATPVSPPQMASSAPSTSPSRENVTVTGFKSREAINSFVKSFVVPTRMTGKIARWEDGICPLTVGQPPATAQHISQHVKDTDYLGYADTNAKREKLAMVTLPIQAWYTTQTKDLHGRGAIDSGRKRNAGATMANFNAAPCPGCMATNRDPIELEGARFVSVTGNHINDGLRSTLYHVIVVVDPRKLSGYEIATLADYIAMLALTQLNSLDVCQQQPSIVNILAPGCERKVTEITQNDLAYLRGLYKMDSDKSLVFQKNEIADRMKETLESGSR